MTPQALDDFLRQWRADLDARLGRMEGSLKKLTEARPNKEFFTVAEVAKIVTRAEYTVRDWARLGRLRGEKTHGGRGRKAEWRFSLAELTRYQAEGLLPDDTRPTTPEPGQLAVRQQDVHGRSDGPPLGPGPAGAG
ncbi:hypothetical protein BH11PLA2_BH11PLA2_48810 [soil metagenome]